MKVFKDLNQLLAFNNAVITIGTFDGVHEGHKKILKQLKEQAITVNGESIVITFYPHPRKVVGDTTGVLLLTTLEEKIELLKKELIDNVVVVEFNEDFANQTAEEYISDFLFKKFKPHTLIIGYDHHFGYKRKGNYELLEKFGQKLGFSVKEIDEKLLSETAISSTRIRK
ncbi:MAG TPA: FAD synthetase family protein, partial [Chitinophagaceae bacterium]|nr:FAD synthetase family protein [Chitinophagaceae bacterium]